MKERPILFNSEMIRAVLAGRKTQTRRVIRNLPDDAEFFSFHPQGEIAWFRDSNGMQVAWPKCPYGWIGDHLWVRETWGTNIAGDAVAYYKATMDQRLVKQVRWKPSIHMPRWASRITLEVTGVRVERVQDIDEYEAVAEGCAANGGISSSPMDPVEYDGISAVQDFASLWDSINAKRGYSWDSNPWVWVVEFTRAVG